MKVGIVPTLYGYSAVVLPPYKGGWELLSPLSLANELKIQLRGQILAALSSFSFSMLPWTNILVVSLFWALWGGTSLYLRLSRYAEIDIKMVILYGWIMFLFFGDGLFALGRYINQIPNLRRAKNIRDKSARGAWLISDVAMPKRFAPLKGETEKEYIARASDLFPNTRPFYEEMLVKEPPLAFRMWPLGLLAIIRFLFIGIRIPRPHVIVELGTLEC